MPIARPLRPPSFRSFARITANMPNGYYELSFGRSEISPKVDAEHLKVIDAAEKWLGNDLVA
jgi:hypothetical protein